MMSGKGCRGGDELEALIRELLEAELPEEKLTTAWRVGKSESGGRGLFATRDIQPSELIFVDIPIIIGPRRSGGVLCVGCHLGEGDGEGSSPLVGCPGGCGLPVCGQECARAARHQAECRLLSLSDQSSQTLGVKSHWSSDLFHGLAALRSLTLDPKQRSIVKALQANAAGPQCWEADLLRHEMGPRLKKDQEEWMRLCCRVMDTNAFETVQVPGTSAHVPKKESCLRSRGSLRGLYPLASLMNHSCSPNSTHSFDGACRMQLSAARFISAGEEICTSYVSQLWDTASRRHVLAKTKQFACRCDRCKDPSEFGSQLSGLPCPLPDCSGVLLNERPLDYRAAEWRCTGCMQLQSPSKVAELQRRQGMYLAGVDSSSPDSVIEFLGQGHVPDTGLVAVQLKAGLNLNLGHIDGYKWSEMNDDYLMIKEKICRDLLSVMDKLRIGNTRLKGLTVFDLHLTLNEKLARSKLSKIKEGVDSMENLKLEIIKTWELAKKILSNDATAPVEFLEKFKSSATVENY